MDLKYKNFTEKIFVKIILDKKRQYDILTHTQDTGGRRESWKQYYGKRRRY
jgi:hypothetical protein